jgi:CheY-like chemotaxis protein
VLVVDDDALMGRVLERILPACAVTVEGDPRAAVQRLVRGEAFEVVLCDLHMPDASAADVLLAAKAVAPALAERFVVMTGGSTCGDDERFLERCGARILYKPFTAEDLAEIVAWALSRGRAA